MELEPHLGGRSASCLGACRPALHPEGLHLAAPPHPSPTASLERARCPTRRRCWGPCSRGSMAASPGKPILGKFQIFPSGGSAQNKKLPGSTELSGFQSPPRTIKCVLRNGFLLFWDTNWRRPLHGGFRVPTESIGQGSSVSFMALPLLSAPLELMARGPPGGTALPLEDAHLQHPQMRALLLAGVPQCLSRYHPRWDRRPAPATSPGLTALCECAPACGAPERTRWTQDPLAVSHSAPSVACPLTVFWFE